MAIPTWSVGQVLSASDVNTWFVPAVAYKTGATTLTTTTLTNDPDLTLPVAASAYYKFTGMLSYQCASTSVNMNWTFTVPAGTDSFAYSATYANTASSLVTEVRAWTDIPGGGTPVAGLGTPVTMEGILHTGGSAGNLQLQFAQRSASGTGITLNAKSHILLQRVG